ncbi:2-hydroxyacid dehydrogenase [uncultured Roseobacter sp.]|uniref:2-hydroxyacid dehydrogenase n=1 Tax=uncultured Roseobacter sp. TaxID=114847 RepID=UPI002603CBCD|nr:2-hydroxyacid dehydrogenase [uncultured Roseobacter sp.]
MGELFMIGGATPVMMDRLQAKFTVHKASEMADPHAWLAEHGASIGYVATNGHDGVRPEYMAAMPNLKAISCYGVGYDAIDTKAAREKGVVVTHTPNVLNAEVATTAVMLMMACYRELLRDDAWVRSGEWEAKGNSPLTRSVDNQTVGILGLGRIGQAIADKLAPFGTTVVYHSRSAKEVPYKYYDNLARMARDVDCMICITPGGPSTNKIVNREVLEALGPNGTLINVSRGSVVDEAEMISALQDGRLGWAGLDVFEAEPHVPEALRALSNVVLLPHVGSATHETRAAMGALTVDNLLQHLEDGTVISPVPECADM